MGLCALCQNDSLPRNQDYHFVITSSEDKYEAPKAKGITFSNAFGLGILAGEEGMGYGSVYSPRLNIINLTNGLTASLGSHIGLILNTNRDNSGATKQSFIGFELPIMLELNLGRSSHPLNLSSFGGFIGLGYGFSTMNQAEPGEAMTKGMFLVGGCRFKGDWGIKLSYLENFNKNIFGAASIIIQWNIN
jgi:hypothetical protein